MYSAPPAMSRADSAPTSAERVTATICLMALLAGLAIGALGTFAAASPVLGPVGVAVVVVSGAVLVVIATRISRRGDVGMLRSIGRAIWGVVKLLP